jgi:DNA repair photolyase
MIGTQNHSKKQNTLILTPYFNLGPIEMQQAGSFRHFPPLSFPKQTTQIIYESKGRAREYSELAANLYKGCSHGCIYCYAPLALKRSRSEFVKSSVRDNVITKFEKDAIKLGNIGEKRPILLSFTTDPYQHIDEKEQLTRKAIKILHDNSLKVSILTKGGKRSERDFDLLAKNSELSEYGTTLVFMRDEDREIIEPFAAPTSERIKSIIKAHDMGIFTYISLEPVWFPEDALEFIELTHEFVDFYKVGKLNYHPHQKSVDWRQFKNAIVQRLNTYKKHYYIKKDLNNY